MKTNVLFFFMLLFLVVGSFSCAQKSDLVDKDLTLVTLLVNDTSFKNFIRLENQRAENQSTNFHGHRELNWKLVNDPQEQLKCKTEEDIKALYTRAGMKNTDVYFRLINEYTYYLAQVKQNFPTLSELTETERENTFTLARNKINSTNKN